MLEIASITITKEIEAHDAEIYKGIINKLGWRLHNTGQITSADWREIVLPTLPETNKP